MGRSSNAAVETALRAVPRLVGWTPIDSLVDAAGWVPQFIDYDDAQEQLAAISTTEAATSAIRVLLHKKVLQRPHRVDTRVPATLIQSVGWNEFVTWAETPRLESLTKNERDVLQALYDSDPSAVLLIDLEGMCLINRKSLSKSILPSLRGKHLAEPHGQRGGWAITSAGKKAFEAAEFSP